MNYKFRAWDTELLTMLSHKQLVNMQVYNSEDYRNTYDIFADPAIVIMCSLGVEDSEGVEVFEGDILSSSMHRTVLFEVFRDLQTGSFFLEPFCKGNRFKSLPKNFEGWYLLWDEIVEHSPKVLGNIYQAKKLLNKYTVD